MFLLITDLFVVYLTRYLMHNLCVASFPFIMRSGQKERKALFYQQFLFLFLNSDLNKT